MRMLSIAAGLVLAVCSVSGLRADEDRDAGNWRSLPLIRDGKVAPGWVHTGWGGFAVENGALVTQCSEKGMGLLVYRPEPFGNCQIRVVFKSKDAKSNSGVFVRVDPKILQKLDEQTASLRRDEEGNLSDEMLEQLKRDSEKEIGPWYAVHHGYEVQICDAADAFHRTGAIYSLAKAAPVKNGPTGDWRTMIITLDGKVIRVELDGQHVTTFDPDSKAVPAERDWYEPKREAQRPVAGFIGLQNHDPGDVVYFREITVRPLK